MPFFLAPLVALTASTIGEIVATTVVATLATKVVSDVYDKATTSEKKFDDDED